MTSPNALVGVEEHDIVEVEIDIDKMIERETEENDIATAVPSTLQNLRTQAASTNVRTTNGPQQEAEIDAGRNNSITFSHLGKL